jgi:leukotriene-A4 hydrolase
MDPNSVANNDEIKILNLNLNLKVDFDSKKLSGFVEIKCEKLKTTNFIHLDVRKLKIEKVEFNQKELNFEIKSDSEFGSDLQIDISSLENFFEISIFYSTTPEGEAIQWLTPEQTVGKKYPYLFSQCQAIHARTM